MTALADVTDRTAATDAEFRSRIARFDAAVTPPEVVEARKAVERVADELRRRAREATDTPCDMDCDPEDCASCGQPIQAFSFINDIPDTIFGDVVAIAAAAVAAYRAAQDGGAEEAVRRVEALAEEMERQAEAGRRFVAKEHTADWSYAQRIRAALATQAGEAGQ